MIKMIPQAIAVHDTFIIILSQHIVFLTCVIHCMTHISQQDKSKGDYFNFSENGNPLYFYCSLKKTPNLLDDISSEQAVVFWFLPPLFPKDYWIHSREANKQKKEIIPYPRCGFGAWLGCDEHLKHSDYRADGIWYDFFFRLSPNEWNSKKKHLKVPLGHLL